MAMIDIIGEIDAEISRLEQAKALLSGTDSVAAKRKAWSPDWEWLAQDDPRSATIGEGSASPQDLGSRAR